MEEEEEDLLRPPKEGSLSLLELRVIDLSGGAKCTMEFGNFFPREASKCPSVGFETDLLMGPMEPNGEDRSPVVRRWWWAPPRLAVVELLGLVLRL